MIKSRAYFEGLLITGYVPTQEDYTDLCDTYLSIPDDMGDNTVLIQLPSAAASGLTIPPSSLLGREAAGNLKAISFASLLADLGAVPLVGATMTGLLVLSGDPAVALGAVTKQYADAADTANATAAAAAQTTANTANTTANAAVPKAGGTMTGLLILSGDPTDPFGAVTKRYADAAFQGLNAKPTATVATTAALATNIYNNGASGLGATITITATGTLTIDGHLVALNDLILIKDEVTASNNGLYVCTVAGAIGVSAVLTRHTDMDTALEYSGGFIPVEIGTANANSLWLCNPSGAVTVGTTTIPFTQLNGATDLTAGTGIGIAGNVISLNVSATGPVQYAAGTFSMTLADTTHDGYISHTDWNTFNGKQAAIGYTPVNKAGDTMSGNLIVNIPGASPNFGSLSAGGGTWDGVTGGFFAGAALGTSIAVNENIGYLGNLMDLQVNGVSAFSIAYGGRITTRFTSTASSATPGVNADLYEMSVLTALAVAATFAAPTGTPIQGQILKYRIKDNGAPQGLTWNSIFTAGDVPLPTTTITGKWFYLTYEYNATLTKWVLLAALSNV